MAHYEQPQTTAQAEHDKSILFVGVIRIINEFSVLVGENGLGIFKADLVLAQVDRRLL